jgi:hypothetical protein
MISQQQILPFTTVFIKLLKGPVEYIEKSAWENLIQYKIELAAFLRQLGLTLVLDEQDGYAYVKHSVSEEADRSINWIQRRALTYEESIMLVLLREMMAEFEIGEATVRELSKKRRDIKEYAEMFFKEKASRVRFLKDIDRLIDKAEENGFLDKTENHDIADEQKFRIKKVIKAKVTSEHLDAFYQQLLKVKEKKEEGNIVD